MWHTPTTAARWQDVDALHVVKPAGLDLQGSIDVRHGPWEHLQAPRIIPVLTHGVLSHTVLASSELRWKRSRKEVCQRAVRVLTQDLRIKRELDWKGHEVVYDSQKRLAYCLNCFTSRKIRDQHFVASSPCPGCLLGAPCLEGSYIVINGHIFRCEMRSWKRASSRPGLICQLCEEWYWPRTFAKRFPHICPRAVG